jgi:hypothetical protein
MAGKKQQTRSRISQRLFLPPYAFPFVCCLEERSSRALRAENDLLLRFVRGEHLNLKNAKPSQTGVTDCATEGPRMRMIFEGLWAEGTNHRKENSDDIL